MIVDQKLGVNFYIKTSEVDKNFDVAVLRNSHVNKKYTVRKHICKLFDNFVEDDDSTV